MVQARTEVIEIPTILDGQFIETDQSAVSHEAVEDSVHQASRPELRINGSPRVPETHIDHQTVNNYHGSVRHSRSANRSLKERAIRGGIALGLVAGGILAVFASMQHDSETATIPHAGVVYVGPKQIDLRAVVDSCISATVHKTYGGWKEVVAAVATNPALVIAGVDSYAESATFTGPEGKGCGEIQTLVGAKATGVKTEVDAKGKETITIPSKDIVFFSSPVGDKSEVTYDQGVSHAFVTAFAELTPLSGVKNKIKQNSAQVVQLSANEAVNVAQEACDKVAWSDTKKAITAAYQGIYRTEYLQKAAQGKNIASYNPNNIAVNITGGSPSFPEAYSIPKSDHFSILHQSACVVEPGALHLNGK
jgi:hypothetical protein